MQPTVRKNDTYISNVGVKFSLLHAGVIHGHEFSVPDDWLMGGLE